MAGHNTTDLMGKAAQQWETVERLLRESGRVIEPEERKQLLRYLKNKAQASLEGNKQRRSKTPTPPRAAEPGSPAPFFVEEEAAERLDRVLEDLINTPTDVPPPPSPPREDEAA